MNDCQYRLRIRYRKSGRLRFLSHLELIRAIERVIRRAGLDYAVTQGFNPHMKVAFGPALPVGTGGDDEYLDVWLNSFTKPGDLLERLKAASPSDLAPIAVGYVSDKERSLTAAINLGEYKIVIAGDDDIGRLLSEGVGRTIDEGAITVQQKGKNKVYDLSRAFWKEPRVQVEEGTIGVELYIRTSNEGSLRPEAYLGRVFAGSPNEPVITSITRVSQAIEEKDGAMRRPL